MYNMATGTHYKGIEYHALHILTVCFYKLECLIFSYIGLIIIQYTKLIKSDTLHHNFSMLAKLVYV